MPTRTRRLLALPVLVLALAGCSGGGGSSPAPTGSPTPTAGASATIDDGGSTNRHPFAIVVQTNGTATVTQNGSVRTATLTAASVARFFADLNANVPVANVATVPNCTKSSSYGTTTTLTYEGSTSGDVSCPPSASSAAQMLYDDVTAIENQLAPFDA